MSCLSLPRWYLGRHCWRVVRGVSPPMDTHIIIITIIQCPPPDLSDSVCLALSLAACCPQLIERQSHRWLITLHGGGCYGPVSQGGTANQEGQGDSNEGLKKEKRKKVDGVKHKGHNRFLETDLYLTEKSEPIRGDLTTEHFSAKSLRKTKDAPFFLSGAPSSW